jgi:hypothetical protein
LPCKKFHRYQHLFNQNKIKADTHLPDARQVKLKQKEIKIERQRNQELFLQTIKQEIKTDLFPEDWTI